MPQNQCMTNSEAAHNHPFAQCKTSYVPLYNPVASLRSIAVK